MQDSESNAVSKGPCPACPSSDGFVLYDDGHSYCFVCNHYQRADGTTSAPAAAEEPIPEGLIHGLRFIDLDKRGLRADTLRHYGYGVAEHEGKVVQVAPYRNALGEVIGQKVRTSGKDFFVLGKLKGALLFGQHLSRTGGKMIVVTEGEIDALSVAQAMSLKWGAVSVPNGAAGAAKAIKANLEWLTSYEKVILWFDNDEAGQAALAECVTLLPAGKVAVVTTPGGCKDANDLLRQEGPAAVARAVWEAPVYRPGGVVAGTDVDFDDLFTAIEPGFDLPYPKLKERMRGLRRGEITLLTAGTGLGKSTLSREWNYFMADTGRKIGLIYLEESVKKTAQAFIAIDNNVPLGEFRLDPTIIPRDKARASYDRLIANGRVFLLDHFGSLDSDDLLSKIEYLAVSEGVDFVTLDHISIVVSGADAAEGERREIDKLMTKLRSLVERTGVGVVAIVHLKKSDGSKTHEEGGRVTLDDLRGSGGLKQLTDNVIALERDQQGENSNITLLRVLKNREFGDVGECDELFYDPKTGRLRLATEADKFADATSEF